MELRSLEYFLAVAREGNVSAAAAKMHLSQPALSRQIKSLEDELGQRLFVRKSHGLSMTPEGQLLHQYAEQVCEVVSRAKQDFSTMKEKPLGDVYLSGCETESLRWIARAIKTCREKQPSMKFHFSAGNEADTLNRFDRGVFDFAVLAQPQPSPKYEYLPLPFEDQWAVHMLESNPLARKEVIRPADLAGEPLIISTQSIGNAAELDVNQWFGDSLGDLNIVATFNLAYMGLLCVQEGLGSLVTYNYPHFNAVPGICSRPFSPLTRSPQVIAWRKNDPLSPAATFFLEALREELKTE